MLVKPFKLRSLKRKRNEIIFRQAKIYIDSSCGICWSMSEGKFLIALPDIVLVKELIIHKDKQKSYILLIKGDENNVIGMLNSKYFIVISLKR
jgi:hypothetical protein